jgi:hypothetical protein
MKHLKPFSYISESLISDKISKLFNDMKSLRNDDFYEYLEDGYLSGSERPPLSSTNINFDDILKIIDNSLISYYDPFHIVVKVILDRFNIHINFACDDDEWVFVTINSDSSVFTSQFKCDQKEGVLALMSDLSKIINNQ